jgi:EAL domain-containing protein (putative c-di-GMP-specific phosphodiesterase class I)
MAPRQNSEGEPPSHATGDDATPLDTPKLGAEIARSLKILLAPDRRGRPCGLLCARVDATDSVKALMGRRGVEKLLLEAYGRVKECIRDTDAVADCDGEILFILAGGLEWEEDLEIMAGRIQRTCSEPYTIQDERIPGSFTIGGAGGSTAEQDPGKLAQNALLALRRAASRGVPFHLFTAPEAQSTAPAASTEAEFALSFQAQFTQGRQLSGARVAAQMPSAKGRKPRQAVAATPEKGHGRIGDRVLRDLLRLRQSWAEAGFDVPTLAIEVEADHLLSEAFADTFLDMLRDTDAPVSAIELLVTEATALTRLGTPQPTLAVLAKAGARLGLCGFSLSAGTRLDLRKLPFSSLRVSCGSLFHATSDRESLWLARSIAGVAHRCGLIVIAEDIATESQLALLAESGWNRFEGPLLSPALAATRFAEFLAAVAPPPP